MGNLHRLTQVVLTLTCISWAVGNTPCVSAAEEPLLSERIFDPTHIAEVSIVVKQEDWQSLCAQTRNFLQALSGGGSDKPFSYFPADVTIDGKTIKNVGIRKKGFLGSLDGARPSLKIKFDEYVADQVPAVGFDRLTLNNNKQDPSRICQYLSYKIFNDSGTVASRCNFAKVTVNGKYLGIYSNVESIRKPFLKDRFGDASGTLYEGTVTDFYPDSVERFEGKNKRSQYVQIRSLTELMDRDAFTLDEVEELLDVKAFVKFWATESLIGFWDGYTNNQNNYFVYRHPKTNKFHFIPWGMDSCFSDSMPIAPFKIDVKSVHSQSVLANRLYRHPEVQTLYLKTMNELLDNHWQEDKLLKEIDNAVTLLKDHVSEDNRGFSKRVADIKSFIQGRRATIEKELATGVAQIDHGSRKGFSFEIKGTAAGSFSTQWSEKTPRNPTAAGKAELEVRYADEVIVFSKLGVTSAPSEDRNNREADGRRPPTVVFHGRRKSDNKQWMMILGTSSEAFRPSRQGTPVFGIVIEGNPMLFITKMMFNRGKMTNLVMVGGTATFDQAKREIGAPVIGTVKVEIGTFKGGEHLPPR
jgi:spore coat protein CotH